MRFEVVLTDEAIGDLNRLSDALLVGVETEYDFTHALDTVQAIRAAVEGLSDGALRCRKAGDGRDPFLREQVIRSGRSGYLALFAIVGDQVVVAAIRHQREDDYR